MIERLVTINEQRYTIWARTEEEVEARIALLEKKIEQELLLAEGEEVSQ